MASPFVRATQEQAKLRLALIGPAGSGKTFTGLTLASELGKRVAVIDTEHGSASKYASLFEFDTVALTDHSPENYIEKVRAAEAAGYDVLLIDSLTHEWKWCLEEIDNVKARQKTSNSYTAWKDVTPRHNALTEAILQSGCHVIATMRAKTEYVLEEVNGKQAPRKIGLAPVQRDGVEFEYDLVGDLDPDNTLVVSKTRCPALAGKVIRKPGADLAEMLKVWLGTGTPAPKKAAPVASEKNEAADDGGGPTIEDRAKDAARKRLFAILDALHKAGVAPPDECETWDAWTKAQAFAMTGEASRSALNVEQWALLATYADAIQKQAVKDAEAVA